MSEKIYYLMFAVLNALGGGWIFIIALGVEIITFVAVLLKTLLSPLYTLKRRAWFFISCTATLLLELAFLSLAKELELFYLTLFITAILFGVVALLPVKQLKISNQERELARFIDKSVKELSPPKLAPFKEPIKEQIKQAEPPVQEANNYNDVSRFELDFQHVKLVLQKLEYYPLSANDKKIMKELEDSILTAENQGFSTQIKNKINDGLGALLKIMSKYGV